MKARKVIFSPEAQADLRKLHTWIADVGGPKHADSYLLRLKAFCERLELGSERGTRRDHVRRGLRIVGFEGRVTVAFVVQENAVMLLRIFYGGANWENRFSESLE